MSLFERWAHLSVGLTIVVPVIVAQVLRRQVLAFEVVKAGPAS